MKQRFTKLLAAVALLVFMMPSMAGWGQTRGDVTLFEETFAASTGTMGWSGNACNGTLTADNEGWTFVKGYGAGGAAKFGTGSALGSAQTPEISVNGSATLTFKAGAWSGDATELKLSSSNCTLDVSSVTLVSSQWSNYTVQITNVTGSVKIKFEGKTTKNSRFLLDDVVITQSSATPTCTVDPESWDFGSMQVGSSAQSKTFTVTTANLTHGMSVSLSDYEYYSITNNVYGFSSSATTTNIVVEFDPSAVGTHTATLILEGDDFDDDIEVPLTATVVSNDPTCTINPTTWEFGNVALGMNATKEFTVTTANLTGDLTLAMSESVYSVTPSTIAQSATTTTVTVTFTPTEAGEVYDELSISGGGLTDPTTAIVTGTGYQAQTYTITFNPGTGTCSTETMTGVSGYEFTLPSATPSQACQDAGWIFAGWATASVGETQTTPALLNGQYTIQGDAVLYAVYVLSESDITVTDNVFSHGSFANSTITWSIDGVVSILQEKHNGQTAPNSSYVSSPRWYSGNKITITPSVSILSIGVTATSENYANELAHSTYTNASAEANGTSVTITPASGNSTITIVMGGQSRLSSLTVSYGSSVNTFATSPLCLEQVATPIISPVDVTTFDNNGLEVSITCETEGATIYYTLDGSEPNNSSDIYSESFTISETTTIKAIAVLEGMDDSEVAVMTYYYIDPNAGTLEQPYTVAQAINAINANVGVTNVYATGIVSRVDYFSPSNHYITYFISSDGTTESDQLEAYHGKGFDGADFYTVNGVQVGDVVVIKGNLLYYEQGDVYEFNTDNQLVSSVRTCSRTILGYDNSNNTNYGGFYLIASPIEGVAPANVTGMTGDNFDLYRFNESAELEWENWKQEGDHNHFNLESGKGYLYAHKTDVTLTFSGTPYTGDGVIPLSYTSGAQFAGWNLVGNPFGVAATIGDQDFYVIGTTTRELIASDVTTISVMEGIFVEADGANQSVTFTPQADQGASGSNTNAVVLNLSRNRGDVIDRAIVRFGEGSQLHKFQLRENSTKVYFTEGNQDFAVVRSQKAQGEMPVNFKAEENGTYTLSVSTEEMELNYLHLIDNMTGMDVDLLQTPSYTFDATTNDYASRFRLVFSANNVDGPSTGSEAFAFYSNGNWVVGNEGEATLQVIDVNGRIVSNETINGTVATNINATPGVYMLRLVNGNEVKTQKIVVR